MIAIGRRGQKRRERGAREARPGAATGWLAGRHLLIAAAIVLAALVPFIFTSFVTFQLTQVNGKPINRDQIEYDDPPLWRRWYVVGPAAVGLAVVTAVIVGYAAHNFPSGDCRKVGGGNC